MRLVNPESRLLVACATLLLSPLAVGAESSAPIVFRIGEPIPRVTESSSPAVFFAIPKYTLSPAERETVAACLVLEAANQGDFGMRSVMAVIRNRARGRPELFAPTVLREKQFSALNKMTAGRESRARLIARAQRDAMWPTALALVDDALEETWHDPTGGATHYTRSAERTPWTRTLAKTVTIGAHSFYR
jgi:spore germination cell wall hydrolase CwlJ-like protein